MWVIFKQIFFEKKSIILRQCQYSNLVRVSNRFEWKYPLWSIWLKGGAWRQRGGEAIQLWFWCENTMVTYNDDDGEATREQGRNNVIFFTMFFDLEFRPIFMHLSQFLSKASTNFLATSIVGLIGELNLSHSFSHPLKIRFKSLMLHLLPLNKWARTSNYYFVPLIYF
jgi:hypothetical protein